MDQRRRQRVLEKLSFTILPWRRERERVQQSINNARLNYEAGGTVAQRQVNDNSASIPMNLTLKDRLRDWVYRQQEVPQLWAGSSGTPGGDPVAPIFTPPTSLGSARGNRALQLLEQNKMTGFGPPSMAGYKDCSTFACEIADVPKMSTDQIYADAKNKRQYFREIPHQQLRDGDFILYPGGVNPKTKNRDFGHIAMYAGNGRIIDSSSSGGGLRYRQIPAQFLAHLENAEKGEGVAPIVVRANKDFKAPYTPVEPPGEQAPITFQPGQFTPKRFLDTGELSPMAPLPVPKAPTK